MGGTLDWSQHLAAAQLLILAVTVIAGGGILWYQVRQLQKFREEHDRDEAAYRKERREWCEEKHKDDQKMKMVLKRCLRMMRQLHRMTAEQSTQTGEIYRGMDKFGYRLDTLEETTEAIRKHLGAPISIPVAAPHKAE